MKLKQTIYKSIGLYENYSIVSGNIHCHKPIGIINKIKYWLTRKKRAVFYKSCLTNYKYDYIKCTGKKWKHGFPNIKGE